MVPVVAGRLDHRCEYLLNTAAELTSRAVLFREPLHLFSHYPALLQLLVPVVLLQEGDGLRQWAAADVAPPHAPVFPGRLRVVQAAPLSFLPAHGILSQSGAAPRV